MSDWSATYHQLTGDRIGAVLGDFKSQVAAVGPQVGHLKVKDRQVCQLMGWEFDT
jgi:hypothetical protein